MSKKVIARQFGGLGNQLFIYATAKALSCRTNSELVMDINTGFRNDAYNRDFSLHHFNIDFRIANRFESFDFPSGKVWRYFFRRFNSFLKDKNRFYLTDLLSNEWFFMPEIINHTLISSTWIEGYWQSPRYFEDISDLLVTELTIKSPLSLETMRVNDLIQRENSVSIHLRMIRDLSNDVDSQKSNKISLMHYHSAMEYISTRIENVHFFCFSDNAEIAKEFLKVPYNITFISHNKGNKDYEDFFLMQQCQHNILANSTFGWWPAWLNSNSKKIIISPPIHYWDNKDILPHSWLTSDQISNFLQQ